MIHNNKFTPTFRSKLLNGDLNNLFLGILVLVLFLAIKNHSIFWFIVAVLLSSLVYKHYVKLLITICLALIGYFVYLLTKSHISNLLINDDFKITKILGGGFVIQHNDANIYVLSKEQFHIGDTVRMSGRVSAVNGVMSDYLEQNNIFSFIKPNDLSLVAKSNSMRSNFQDFLNSGPSYFVNYAPLIILGLKSDGTKAIYEIAIKINVVHLFVISGFHISLFYLLLNKILSMARVPKQIALFIPLIPICLYLYLINFQTPALRATIFIFLVLMNKEFFQSRFSRWELLTLVLIGLFLYKPYQITSFSFILTFLASYIIALSHEIKFKSKSRKYIGTSLLIYFSTWPIIVYINGFISPLGIVFGPILSPLFIFIYSASLILFPLKTVLDQVYQWFDWILQSVGAINFTIDFKYLTLLSLKIIYLIPLAYLIIWKTWFSFTEKKNI